MTTKYTPFAKDYHKRTTRPYKLDPAYASARRPVEVPLSFKNLKPNTKYSVFLKNSSGTQQEDITRFCKPYHDSLKENNGTKNWSFFLSNAEGKLFVLARPYGTSSVDPGTRDWTKHWRTASSSLSTNDVGRENFVIVETSRVTAGSTDDKIKVVPDDISVVVNGPDLGTIKQNVSAEYIQTFFIDPNVLGNSSSVDITDLTLYFRNKPLRRRNRTGLQDPGVTVFITEVVNDIPDIDNQLKGSVVDLSWSQIGTSPDASVGTTFPFAEPVRLQAGREYAIGISVDDDLFVLWDSRKGDVLVGSNELSSGSSAEHRGALYLLTNAHKEINNTNFDSVYSKKTDIDLKFDIHAAEYDISDITIDFINPDYEFFTITNSTENFHGSEFVYQETANSAGTVSISGGSLTMTGVGTTLTSLKQDDRIVVTDGAETEVFTVERVLSDTLVRLYERSPLTFANANFKIAPCGVVDHYDYNQVQLFIRESNANTTLKFAEGSTVVGVDSGTTAVIDTIDALPISVFSSDTDLDLPPNYKVQGTYDLSYDDQGVFRISNTNTFQTDLNLLEPNHVTKYEGVILSRSLEANTTSANLFDSDDDGAGDKSTRVSLTFQHQGSGTKSFESPVINMEDIGIATKLWQINNDTTDEHTNYGKAITKHVSQPLSFGEENQAEDIRVIYNAYKPQGVDIAVYAKIINAEDPQAIDDKSWTRLDLVSGANQVSDQDDDSDFREFEYGFPATIPSDQTLDGVFTTEVGNNVIQGSGTSFSGIVEAGDVIKVYSDLFDENYQFFSVEAIDAGAETITLTEPIPNSNIAGTGFKVDTTATPHTAYNNPDNNNIVRYFGPNGESYDTYDTVIIKTVLLSDDYKVVPTVDDYRVIGVSA